MSRASRAAAILGLIVSSPSLAESHPFAPGHLELVRTAPDQWQVTLRQPRVGLPSALRPVWPDGCQTTPMLAKSGDASWRLTCSGPLRRIQVSGFIGKTEEVLVRLQAGSSAELYRLNASAPFADRPETPRDPGAWTALGGYFWMGVEHILLGYDHLAFIVLLVLIVHRPRALVGHLTLFTVAHSITLSLTALELVAVRPAPTEAMIALSIAFTARELLRPQTSGRGRTPALAFGFGLLHGLGLAGALIEVGLPPHRRPEALVGFNLGVEGGQLLVVVVLIALGTVFGRVGIQSRRVVAYGFGGAAAYWTTARVMEMVYGA